MLFGGNKCNTTHFRVHIVLINEAGQVWMVERLCVCVCEREREMHKIPPGGWWGEAQGRQCGTLLGNLAPQLANLPSPSYPPSPAPASALLLPSSSDGLSSPPTLQQHSSPNNATSFINSTNHHTPTHINYLWEMTLSSIRVRLHA
jgi:hypothetical protein